MQTIVAIDHMLLYIGGSICSWLFKTASPAGWPAGVLEPLHARQHRMPCQLHRLMASSEMTEANLHNPLCSPCAQYTWLLRLPACMYIHKYQQ